MSKKYVLKNIDGIFILMTVFNDLTDQELIDQFKFYIAKEDYEYCEELQHESKARGFLITSKLK